jgi:hypothetical protein
VRADANTDAIAAIRGLIDSIVLTPDDYGAGLRSVEPLSSSIAWPIGAGEAVDAIPPLAVDSIPAFFLPKCVPRS